MKMLRSFAYEPDLDIVADTLGRFKLNQPEHITIVRFEVITPDSFMWRLVIDENVYYIYAEDYVPGIGHIKSIFNQYLKNDKWDLVKPKKVIKFEDSTPVKGAATYMEPNDSYEMMRYAVDSGHDFVFLVRSNEDVDNAYFSDLAPRGFNPRSQ